jgi:CheY-like chemotaxis protein
VIADTKIETTLERRHGCRNGFVAPTRAEGLRVLLAESDAGNAEFMSLLLHLDGHRVQVARTGLAALRLARADPPDVVLLEIRLPGMDGWEVARRLGESAAEKMPFCIALTGSGTRADRRRSAEAGIHLHLVKPLQPGFLRPLLKRFQAIIQSDEKPRAGGNGNEPGYRTL